MSGEELEYRIRTIIDYHLDYDVIGTGECGCPDDVRAEWQDRMKIIGEQAYRDHVHERVMLEIQKAVG